MRKRFKAVVEDTQQQVTTTVERDGDSLVVEILACPPLDQELRKGFHDAVETLGNESISVRSHTDYSNQGNETWQVVTVEFEIDEKLAAVDILDQVISIGKDYYERQLERDLARESEGDSNWRHASQQLYFEDEDIEEFCLLFRGKVDI